MFGEVGKYNGACTMGFATAVLGACTAFLLVSLLN